MESLGGQCLAILSSVHVILTLLGCAKWVTITQLYNGEFGRTMSCNLSSVHVILTLWGCAKWVTITQYHHCRLE